MSNGAARRMDSTLPEVVASRNPEAIQPRGDVEVAEKSKVLLSLGAALASLTGLSVQGAEAKSITGNDVGASAAENTAIKLEPNAHYQVGEDLLGFVVTKQPDGTIVAQHASHASHASPASPASSR